MTEPIAPLIARLDSLITQQTETNALLRRIVPDDRVFPGGLYDLLRFGLYRATPDTVEPGEFVYTPQPNILYDLLRDEATSQTLAQIATAIATNTNNTRIAAAATSNNVFDLSVFLANQLSPGVASLNIAEQLNAIRENTGGDEPGALLDALNALALQQRTLVTFDGASQTFTTAELLYALGVCSCPDFPELPPPPAPPPVFPVCLETTAGQNQYRFQMGPAVALTQAVLFTVTFDVYVHPLLDAEVQPAQGQSLTPIAATNGNAYFHTRDNTLTWNGASSSFGWAEPGSPAGPTHFLIVPWTVATPNPTQAQVQTMVNARQASINLNTQGRCVAGQFVAATANPDTSSNWRAVLTLWPVGQGPASQGESEYVYVRLNPPPGI